MRPAGLLAAAHPEVHVSPGALANTYRVLWPLPRPAPLVSLLIPTRDRRALTETCVRSILDKTAYTNFESSSILRGFAFLASPQSFPASVLFRLLC